MNYIIVITDYDYGSRQIVGTDIANALLSRNLWLLKEEGAHRKHLDKGDRILFYLGGKGNRCFIADGVIESKATVMTKEELKIAEEIGIKRFGYTIKIAKLNIWKNPVAIADLLAKLSFIKDRKYWGLYFRNSIREISDADYSTVMAAAE